MPRVIAYDKLSDPTVGERLHCAYAHLAAAVAAVNDGVEEYNQKHWAIVNSMYRDLRSGTKNVRPLADDVGRQILRKPQCAYCGNKSALTQDHIIPRYHGGEHKGDNLIVACKRCNSSKGSRDLMEWFDAHEEFPRLWVLQKFLKLGIDIATTSGKMNMSCGRVRSLPFSVQHIPVEFPPLSELEL